MRKTTRKDVGWPDVVAEGGKSDRHAESYQGSRCVERNDDDDISKPTKPIKKTVCFHCGSDSCLSSQQPPCHANRGFYHHIKGHFTWRKVNPVNQAGFPMQDLANLSFTSLIRFAKS